MKKKIIIIATMLLIIVFLSGCSDDIKPEKITNGYITNIENNNEYQLITFITKEVEYIYNAKTHDIIKFNDKTCIYYNKIDESYFNNNVIVYWEDLGFFEHDSNHSSSCRIKLIKKDG